MPVPNLLGFTAPVKAEGWAVMTLGPGPLPSRYDLCEDCAEVLVEQFMVGANVHAITQPPGMNILPHDNVPYQDCLLAFDPELGGFVCEHDDPERFRKLCTDRAQNVAEGVPERKICSNCGCVSHKEFGPCSSTGCECTVDDTGKKVPTLQDWADKKRGDLDRQLMTRIGQLAGDMHTAGWAHSIVQRCGDACSEQHTHTSGCLLDGVVQVKKDVPGQIMPPACGAECDPKMGNHTNVLGTCMNNPSTGQAVLVVCPVCKEEGSLGGIIAHMVEHGYQPDYANAQWVDGRGYNLDGRLISQQGEDLTEAYSEQEAAE